MAYKMESIKKALNKANEYKTIFSGNTENIDTVISTGNRKIGRVMNVSLMPVLTCANCKECMHFCYDIKACLQYPDTVIKARMKNTVLLWENREKYFSQIENKINRRRKNKYFRWHVAGDIIDIDYLSRMIEIARRHSDFVFWTYTKNYSVVNAYCEKYGKNAVPENLHIMFSEWDGLTLDNPYHFPIFTCKLKSGNKNHADIFFETLFRCPGNCDICKESKSGCIGGMDTYAIEH